MKSLKAGVFNEETINSYRIYLHLKFNCVTVFNHVISKTIYDNMGYVDFS